MKPKLVLVLLAAILAPPAAGQAVSDPAELFKKGMNALTGTAPSQNFIQAIDYLRQSASRGYAPAQTVLGYCYESSFGVVADPAEAVSWYKKAAQQGDKLTFWVLGKLYFTGAAGPQDLTEAEKWLLRSAEAGNPFGQYILGLVREIRDYKTAPEWFRKAAAQGLPYAQQKLGLMLKDGRGVALDKRQAYVWLLVSYQAGLTSSGGYVSELEGEFGSTEIERLKTKARELQAEVSRSVIAHDGCTGWPGELDPIPATPPPEIQRFCR